jgi:hypothetical protein
MSGEKRYQRLPKDQTDYHDDDDDDDDEHEDSLREDDSHSLSHHGNSLVIEDTHNIFRSSPWKAKADRDAGGEAMETLSTAGSTASSLRGNIVSSASAASASASSQMHGMLSRSHSNNSDFDLDADEWEDDDDVGAVRRYHLDFEHARDNLPVPAEFSHESLPKRLWRSFLVLRASARQRRAARLLTMPSESFHYKSHACLLTWCCDATDRGILLVVGLVAAWLLVGWAGSMSSGWWWMGLLLFVTRVTARRLLEYCLLANRKLRRRQRLESVSLTPVVEAPIAAWGESDPTNSLQQVV